MQRTHDPARVAQALAEGDLVAVPTETVYGLAADATNEAALRRVFEVKGRPPSHPLIVHVLDAAGLNECAAEVPDVARRLVEEFWPGPLTLILQKSPGISDTVTGGRETVAVRAPDHPLTREVLGHLGRPLAAPSANRFGQVSPTTPEAVEAALGTEIDVVLDGGECDVGVESTIVDLTGPSPTLLRPGGISRERLEAVLGTKIATDTGAARAPGMLPSHYAPAADVVVCEPGGLSSRLATIERAASVAVLCTEEVSVPVEFARLDAGPDTESYARRLYTLMREADSAGYAAIVAVLPPAAGLGEAVRDRLSRAASEPR